MGSVLPSNPQEQEAHLLAYRYPPQCDSMLVSPPVLQYLSISYHACYLSDRFLAQEVTQTAE